MNLYIRYFDRETLVYSVDEAIDFLHVIGDIDINPELEADIREYVAMDVYYPKRYKVRPRVYFIIIKTSAQTLEDFKNKKALRPNIPIQNNDPREFAPIATTRLTENLPGWYECTYNFRRVVTNVTNGKHEYRDTHFVVRCKGMSPQDCYERIVDNLKSRVDKRSQFPSAKGKNFQYKYLGMWK